MAEPICRLTNACRDRLSRRIVLRAFAFMRVLSTYRTDQGFFPHRPWNLLALGRLRIRCGGGFCPMDTRSSSWKKGKRNVWELESECNVKLYLEIIGKIDENHVPGELRDYCLPFCVLLLYCSAKNRLLFFITWCSFHLIHSSVTMMALSRLRRFESIG